MTLCPDRSQQASDFSVLAFSQFQFQKCTASLSLQQLDALEPKKSIGKVHALFQFGDYFRCRNADNLSTIAAYDFVTRVGQVFGQTAVIRNQQQSLSVFVQSPDGKHAVIAVRYKIHRTRSATGVTVGTKNAIWFVQQKVLEGRKSQAFSVGPHILFLRIHRTCRVRHHLSVHRDSTVSNQCLAVTARIYARVGQKLLQTQIVFRR